MDASGRDRARSVSGKYVEGAIIAALLTFNAALGFLQEGRAQATLAARKSRLALKAAVRRDNAWTIVPSAELVVGDLMKLSVGAVVAADVRLSDGSVLLDQSMLTGESVLIEAGARFQAYAGALVRRGEAVAEVIATAARTKFGRTADLVRAAPPNELKVVAVHAMAGFDQAHVLGPAALASSDRGQDSVDAAIRGAAEKQTASDLLQLIKFVPFDPATKMSEASASVRAVRLCARSRELSRRLPSSRNQHPTRTKWRTNLRPRASEFWPSPVRLPP